MATFGAPWALGAHPMRKASCQRYGDVVAVAVILCASGVAPMPAGSPGRTEPILSVLC